MCFIYMYNNNDFKSRIYLGYKTHQVDVYIKRNQIIPGLRLKMKIDNRIDLVTEIDIKSSHEQQRVGCRASHHRHVLNCVINGQRAHFANVFALNHRL